MICIIKRYSEIINFESSAKLVKEAGFYLPFGNKIECGETKSQMPCVDFQPN